jgi:hypothetical protein
MRFLMEFLDRHPTAGTIMFLGMLFFVWHMFKLMGRAIRWLVGG